MENELNSKRVTLSISEPTNVLLEDLQHHLRNQGSRRYKSEIVHGALLCYAEGLGFEPEEVVGDDPSDEPVGDQNVGPEQPRARKDVGR